SRRLFGFCQTHLQGFQNVDDRSFVGWGSRLNDFLALDFGLDHGHQVLAVIVLIFSRLEWREQGLNQHLRESQFFILHFAGVGAELFYLPDLVLKYMVCRRIPRAPGRRMTICSRLCMAIFATPTQPLCRRASNNSEYGFSPASSGAR